MAYMFKNLSELPTNISNHLLGLNIRFAEDQSKLRGCIIDPKLPEDYEFILVNDGKGITTIYGELPSYFGDPAKRTDFDYIRLANCYIMGEKIIKNRWGYDDN